MSTDTSEKVCMFELPPIVGADLSANLMPKFIDEAHNYIRDFGNLVGERIGAKSLTPSGLVHALNEAREALARRSGDHRAVAADLDMAEVIEIVVPGDVDFQQEAIRYHQTLNAEAA